MPSFVNLGAYVDCGTMVDTWATVGSCAQIGKNCHISGGAGIGGVLEPLQAGPGHHRGQLLHRRALRSRRRRDRARGRGAVDGRLSRRLDHASSTARPARLRRAKCRPIRSSCPARCRASRCRRQPGPLLRGDRQARRRDARAPRPASTSCCGIEGRRPCPPIPSPSPAICCAARR